MIKKIMTIAMTLAFSVVFISCASKPAEVTEPVTAPVVEEALVEEPLVIEVDTGVEAEITEDAWVNVTISSIEKCGCFYTSGPLGLYDMFEVEFKKDSGYEDSCFGLVFGYTSQKAGILADYIRFEINTLGEFALYNYDGAVYKDLINDDAENTAYLNEHNAIEKGLGNVNKLKVLKTSEDKYNCYINGELVAENIEPMENGTDGFMTFYSVGKEEQEQLPDVPVEISFRVSGFAPAGTLKVLGIAAQELTAGAEEIAAELFDNSNNANAK